MALVKLGWSLRDKPAPKWLRHPRARRAHRWKAQSILFLPMMPIRFLADQVALDGEVQ